LNADLATCKQRFGQGFLRMEAAFPEARFMVTSMLVGYLDPPKTDTLNTN